MPSESVTWFLLRLATYHAAASEDLEDWFRTRADVTVHELADETVQRGWLSREEADNLVNESYQASSSESEVLAGSKLSRSGEQRLSSAESSQEVALLSHQPGTSESWPGFPRLGDEATGEQWIAVPEPDEEANADAPFPITTDSSSQHRTHSESDQHPNIGLWIGIGAALQILALLLWLYWAFGR